MNLKGFFFQMPSFPLPTRYRGNRIVRKSVAGRKFRKRKGPGKEIQRDIFFIPHDLAKFVQTNSSLALKVPRGSNRTRLVTLGLSAKLKFFTDWTPEQLTDEISGLFADCFQSTDSDFCFSFQYLSIIPGMKLLHQPKVNAAFYWDGAAVAALGRTPLYVLANANCKLKPFETEVEVNVDSSEEEAMPVVSCSRIFLLVKQTCVES